MTDTPETTCPSCGAPVAAGARFCESCGAATGAAGDTAPVTPLTPPPGLAMDAPISAPTRRPADALVDPVISQGRRPCLQCGGEVGPDGYCQSCGTKAPTERDHFREQPATWVAGVCDRGITHARNEDALALLASTEPGSRAVLVVMDGVSNSIDSDIASLAGARAAREVLRRPLPSGMGTADSKAAAITGVLNDAAKAANTAILAVTDPDSPNPASATFTAVVLEGTRLHHANIGDSRSYWIPDEGDPVQLSVDDSLAQAQMAAGVVREVAENSPQAHAITKWLGRDSDDVVPSVGSLDIEGDGWVLACSDGLWNYASEPEALTAQIRAAGSLDPAVVALKLVEFAHGRGGQDNITVALARVGTSGEVPGVTPGVPEGAAVQNAVAESAPVPPPPPAPPAPPASPTNGPEGVSTDG